MGSQFSKLNWNNSMLFLQELIYKTFTSSCKWILIPVPNPVDVFPLSPTCAICTVHIINLFAVQFKSWGYLLRCFILWTSLPLCIFTWKYTAGITLHNLHLIVMLFKVSCLCDILFCKGDKWKLKRNSLNKEWEVHSCNHCVLDCLSSRKFKLKIVSKLRET